MKQAITLDDFILSWNRTHDFFFFSVQKIPVMNRPVAINICYWAASYPDFFSVEEWYKLVDIVETKSRSTMHVVSDEDLFRKGIIEIKVASANRNYKESVVVGVLKWIGEELFPATNINENS